MRGGAAALQSWGGKLAQGAQRGLWGAGLRPGGGRHLIPLPRGAVGFSRHPDLARSSQFLVLIPISSLV